MDIANIIVKTKKEARENLLMVFEGMPHISRCEIKEDQIILVLDTDDIRVLTTIIEEIQKKVGVTGVYPTFCHA